MSPDGWEEIDAETVIEELGPVWVPESCRSHTWAVQHHAMGSRYRCQDCDQAGGDR